MNRKERIQMIKSVTTLGTKFNVGEYGEQPVTRITEHNCFLTPNTCKTGSSNRYAWTTIHDLIKDKQISFSDQGIQEKVKVSFNR